MYSGHAEFRKNGNIKINIQEQEKEDKMDNYDIVVYIYMLGRQSTRIFVPVQGSIGFDDTKG